MYNASSDFLEAISNSRRELSIKLTITTADGVERELEQKDIEAGTFQITTQCMNKGFELGNVTAGDLSVSLNNRDGRWDHIKLNGAIIEPYCGVRVKTGEFEHVPMGVFIVDSPGRPYSSLSLKATDKMVLLDRSITQAGVTYPTSPRTLLLAISRACGVTVDPDTFTVDNIDEEVLGEPISDITCRDAVAEIALLAGGFARMNRSGVLEIVPLVQPNLTNSRIMGVGSRKNLRVTSDQISITGMSYEGITWGTDDYVLRINRLSMLDDDQAQQVLGRVWSRVQDFHYTAYTADYYSDPTLDVGDGVYHEPFKGQPFLSLITKHTYRHGRLSLMMAEAKSPQEQGYVSKTTRELTEAVRAVEVEIGRRVTAYEKGQDDLTNLMGSMLGVHMTIKTDDETGAKEYYFHNNAILEESDDVWKFSGGGLAHSSDGGLNWDLGLTSSSNLIIKMIQAIGIEADWIHLQQGTLKTFADETGNRITEAETNITEITDSHIKLSQTVSQHTEELQAVDGKIDDKFQPVEERITRIEPGLATLEGRVTLIDGEGLEAGTKSYMTQVSERFVEVTEDINALATKQSSLEMGQGNLLMNPSFGTGTDPDGAYWNRGLTWGEAEIREITWGEAETNRITWGDAEEGRV